MWQEVWFPNAASLYSDDRLRKDGQGSVRVSECVSDFRDWASSSLSSAYDFSKAPNETVGAILHDTKGAPILQKSCWYSMGSFSAATLQLMSRQIKRPAVGMERRRISEYVDGDRYSDPPRRLILRVGEAGNANASHDSGGWPIHSGSPTFSEFSSGEPHRRAVLRSRSVHTPGEPPTYSDTGYSREVHGAQSSSPTDHLVDADGVSEIANDVRPDTAWAACRCGVSNLPTSHRGRTHYRCEVDGCCFAADREIRLAARDNTHDVQRIHRICNAVSRWSLAGKAHYHCRFCTHAFARPTRLLPNELPRNLRGIPGSLNSGYSGSQP